MDFKLINEEISVVKKDHIIDKLAYFHVNIHRSVSRLSELRTDSL